MSIKIYTAWRCPTPHINTVLTQYREACLDFASRELRKEIKLRRVPRIMSKKPEDRRNLETNVRKILIQSVEASKSHERGNDFDFDASLNVWFEDLYALIIPYTEMNVYVTQVPKYAENYCYYNNTDRPKDVSEQQWKQREKDWNKACLNDWDKTRLVYQVIDAKNRVGLIPLVRRAFPHIDTYNALPKN